MTKFWRVGLTLALDPVDGESETEACMKALHKVEDALVAAGVDFDVLVYKGAVESEKTDLQ